MFINIIARFILVFGGLFYLVNASGIKINSDSITYRILAGLVGICALYFVFDRDYYLPFLGKSVIPAFTTPKESNGSLIDVKLVDLPPNTKIIYWAAKSEYPKSGEVDWRVYNDYSNSGITQSDIRGNAIARINCPLGYNVPLFMGLGKRKLKRHIHYRYEIPSYMGLFSKVYTKYIDSCQ